MMSDTVIQAAIHSLRKAGYAVVVFNPDELRGVPPDRLEDRLIELGNEMIDQLGDAVECDHDWVTSEEDDRTYCLNCGEDGDG